MKQKIKRFIFLKLFAKEKLEYEAAKEYVKELENNLLKKSRKLEDGAKKSAEQNKEIARLRALFKKRITESEKEIEALKKLLKTFGLINKFNNENKKT